MKAATPRHFENMRRCTISIHAAREGGDHLRVVRRLQCPISIHAAREGGDLAGKRFVTMAESFQSTPPVKAATRPRTSHALGTQYFNPRRP